jgi:uncharacterized alkaline shock family protein YloU
MPDASPRPVPGKAVVARRGLVEIVRAAVLGSYGVTGLAEPTLLWRIRAALRLGTGAIRVNLQPDVQVDVWVTVAFGLPVAEVARQIDSAVRYGLQHALEKAVGPIAIHVEGVAGRPFVSAPPEPRTAAAAEAEPEPVGPAGPIEPAEPAEPAEPSAGLPELPAGGGA